MNQSTALEKPTAASIHTSIAGSASVSMPTMAMMNDAITSPSRLHTASTSADAIDMSRLTSHSDLSHFASSSSLFHQHHSQLNKRNIVPDVGGSNIDLSNSSQACNILQSILDTPIFIHPNLDGFTESFPRSMVNQQVLKQASMDNFQDDTSVVHKDLLTRNYMLSCMYSPSSQMLMQNIDQQGQDNIHQLNLLQSSLFNKPSTSLLESCGSLTDLSSISSLNLKSSSTVSRSISPHSSLSVSPEDAYNSASTKTSSVMTTECLLTKNCEVEMSHSDDNDSMSDSGKNSLTGEEEQDQELDSILGFVPDKNAPKSTNSIFDFPGMDNGNDMQFTPPDSPEAPIPTMVEEEPPPPPPPQMNVNDTTQSFFTHPSSQHSSSTIFPSAVPNILPFSTLTPQMIDALRLGQLHAANLAKGFQINPIPSLMLHEQLLHHEKMLISAAAALAAAEVVAKVTPTTSDSLPTLIEGDSHQVKEEVKDLSLIDATTCISPMPKIDVKEIEDLDETINIMYGQDPESPPPADRDSITMKPISKSNKVPIYKQNKKAAATTSSVAVDDNFDPTENNEKDFDCDDDEYKFEEDDEEIGFQEMKEKIQHEEVPKLARALGLSHDPNSSNCYIPGIGFAGTSEKPENGRGIYSKKRGADGSKTYNSASGSPHYDSDIDVSLLHSEIVSIAETMRDRKRERFVCSFVRADSLSDSECAKDVKGEEDEDLIIPKAMKVPKLIIRLPKRVLSEYNQDRKKKKKKRKRQYDDDSDWEEKNQQNHRTSRHSSRKSSSEELLKRKKEVHQEDQGVQSTSKKKRLTRHMMNDDPENSQFLDDNLLSFETIREMNDKLFGQAKHKLNKFGSACGVLPKGTFVVNKTDLSRDDCALWKVDNQNLLQKFPPRRDPVTHNIHYKNSSTYSGWCEQISIGYFRVSVRILKQSRSEAIIEPEVPLAELFPALANDLTDSNVAIEEVIDPLDDDNSIPQEGLEESLCTFTLAMLEQAFTMEYFQSAKLKNDWSFLRAKNEVEEMNLTCLHKLNERFRVPETIRCALEAYNHLNVLNEAYEKDLYCQLCFIDKNPVECIIQLMCPHSYDTETLQSVNTKSVKSDERLPAIEHYSCKNCAALAKLYHGCFHMKFHFLRACEDKLETIGTQHPHKAPEKIVDIARKRRKWQSQIQNEYCDIWKKVNAISVK